MKEEKKKQNKIDESGANHTADHTELNCFIRLQIDYEHGAP